jgi:hypothetical protein
MGRLPTHFADQRIKFRIPYTMPGELVLGLSATGVLFPDSTFLHNVDKPFEVHRVVVNTYPFDDGTPPDPLDPLFCGQIPDHEKILRNFVRTRIQDTSKNELMNKSAQLLSTLVKDNSATWEWEDPYTIVRSEGFTVSADCLLAAGYPITVDAVTVNVENVRFGLTFEGYLIVVAPPSETR